MIASEELKFNPELQMLLSLGKDILTSSAKKLKRLISDGMDSFDAFHVSQHHLIQVGVATFTV